MSTQVFVIMSSLTFKNVCYKSGARSYRIRSMCYCFYMDKLENVLHLYIKGNLTILSHFAVIIVQSKPCIATEYTASIE